MSDVRDLNKPLTNAEWQAIAILRSVANLALANESVCRGIILLRGRVLAAVDVANGLLRRTADTPGEVSVTPTDDAPPPRTQIPNDEWDAGICAAIQRISDMDRKDALEAAGHIRDEADFNRSWIDGRHQMRGASPEYVARRIEVAEQRERWAAAIERLANNDRDRALIEAVTEWAAVSEGSPNDPADARLLKALWTYEGDRTTPCDECDGECGEPCAPCTVGQAHGMLDAFIADWNRKPHNKNSRNQANLRKASAAAGAVAVVSHRRPIPVPAGGFPTNADDARWLEQTLIMRMNETLQDAGIHQKWHPIGLYDLLLLSLNAASRRSEKPNV